MIAFSIGSVDIYRYGIFYFIAFVAWYLFFHRIAKKNIFWSKFPHLQTFLQKNIDDFMLCIFLWVLLWGRLGHVIIYDFHYYLSHPSEIFQVRKWGMSFIGGIFGVTIALFLLAWKKRLSMKELLLLGDLIFAILPFGIMLGRIGNFLNQELYGIVVPKNILSRWNGLVAFLTRINIFHIYSQIDLQLRINTNFLSSFFEWWVLLLINLCIIRTRVRTKNIQPGKIVATFLMWYSFIRFFLEYLRADSQLEFHGRFSTSQWFFLVFFVVGVSIFVRQKNKKN